MARTLRIGDRAELHFVDCLEVLRALPDNTIDSVVTDAPYGLGEPPDIVEVLECWLAGKPWKAKGGGFMGHEWDRFVPGPEVWRECLRVLKPGGHALVFAGTRTVDVMGLALRLAGFEIRDELDYLYGSGMPKSLNVSKAIDAAAGAERTGGFVARKAPGGGIGMGLNAQCDRCEKWKLASDPCRCVDSGPATEAAKQWDGWGTALKPAKEPIILCRKPLPGTVAANVQEWGTGGINVDDCRVASGPDYAQKCASAVGYTSKRTTNVYDKWEGVRSDSYSPLGRWPANVILDSEAAALLDTQSGSRPGMSSGGKHRERRQTIAGGGHDGNETHLRGDDGGASRFFFTAKTSKAERHEGCHYLPRTKNDRKRWRQDMAETWGPRALNIHPTVKPINDGEREPGLMRWLCRLVTPPGGVVLDPFMGSGSTGCAAMLEGFRFIGCELEGRSFFTAAARIRHFNEVSQGAPRRRQPPVRKGSGAAQMALFALEGTA